MDYEKPEVTVYELELCNDKDALVEPACHCTAGGSRVRYSRPGTRID